MTDQHRNAWMPPPFLMIRQAGVFQRSNRYCGCPSCRRLSDQIRHHPNIVLNTPESPTRSCAIANVGIATIKPADLSKRLFENYKIFTVAIDNANVRGVRVTPHLYTTTTELDSFVKALKELAA